MVFLLFSFSRFPWHNILFSLLENIFNFICMRHMNRPSLLKYCHKNTNTLNIHIYMGIPITIAPPMLWLGSYHHYHAIIGHNFEINTMIRLNLNLIPSLLTIFVVVISWNLFSPCHADNFGFPEGSFLCF